VKLDLDNFELKISAATWNAALDIDAESGVKSLLEVEKNFWVSKVEQNEQPFETEIIITPRRIKAFTCDCWSEGRKLICPHIAASLLKIRQYLEKKTEEKRDKQALLPEKDNNKFTIQTVLANITPEDLSEFVKSYSRKDKDFALSLKTWYAGMQGESETHFQHLLEAVIPKVKNGKPIPDLELRRVKKMLDDFTEHLESTENYRLIYQISSTILAKVLPLLAFLNENQRDKIYPFCEVAFDEAVSASDKTPSPELKADFWKILFELVNNENLPKDLQKKLIAYLAKKSVETDKFDQISDLFYQKTNPVAPFFLHLYIAALAQKGIHKGGIHVLEDHLYTPETIRNCIINLYYWEYFEAATEMIDYFLPKNCFTTSHTRELEELSIQISEKQGDKTRMKKSYRQRFISAGNFEYFQKLKALVGKKWETELESLVKEITKKGNHALVASVLLEEKHYPLLEFYIVQQNDASLLRQLENKLLVENRNFLKNHYILLLKNYLEKHFGLPASDYIKRMLSGLVLKKEFTMVNEIVNDLCKHFDERNTLSEELADMFPKGYRTK
jgi:hypothetical protein